MVFRESQIIIHGSLCNDSPDLSSHWNSRYSVPEILWFGSKAFGRAHDFINWVSQQFPPPVFNERMR